MTPDEINLTNCDKEPIQFLGKIQSYGFLIAASVDKDEVRYVSANINKFIALSPGELLGKPLNFFNDHIDFAGGVSFLDFCKNSVSGSKQGEDFSITRKVTIGSNPFYLVVSHANDLLVLEFQPSHELPDLTTKVFNMASRILSVNMLEELYNRAAVEIKSLIGYDRVMIYKFLPDGSGQVVGEAVDDKMEPFMGQRYPESDIPRQARALYKLNRMRLISDVNSEDVEVLGNPGARPFDMTHCTLRAVSPTHILYCKNMGLGSSFSISIIVDDELWGLITCHNTTSKHIDFNIRQSAMLLNNVISTRISNKTSEIRKLQESVFQKQILQLQYYLSIDNSVSRALTRDDTNLMHVTHANGVALIYKGDIFLMGETPGKQQVNELAEWAASRIDNKTFFTNSLVKDYPDAENFQDEASGVLITFLGNQDKDQIIWFKKEKPTTILWAGEPKKGEVADPTTESGVKIVPRQSFKVWRETVRQTSDDWSEEEVNAANQLTQIIRDLTLKKAEEQLAIDSRLKEAYDELDSFTYTVSHDLRNPLGVIKNYAQFLIHSGQAKDERTKSVVSKIISGSDRITDMLGKLLELSKMSRQEISNEMVKMDDVIRGVINEQKMTGKYGNTEVRLGDRPDLKGNTLLVYHIFSNIISNAFKYSSKSDRPVVSVNGYFQDHSVVYEIGDNGIGMGDASEDPYVLFRRLENAKDFEGTGAGLTIVKKNIEKLGGKVSFKQPETGGTVFILTFDNQETNSELN